MYKVALRPPSRSPKTGWPAVRCLCAVGAVTQFFWFVGAGRLGVGGALCPMHVAKTVWFALRLCTRER